MPEIVCEANVQTVAFSKDGSRLLGICQDGKLRAWDAKTGKPQASANLEGGAGSEPARLVARSLTRDSFATRTGNSLQIRDGETGQIFRQFEDPELRLASATISADRALLAVSGRLPQATSEFTVELVDSSGKPRFRVPAGLGGISVMAVSPDGKTLVAGGFDADLRAWSTANGELLRHIQELNVAMFAMDFSPDGRYLATAGADRTVYLWDTKTWKISRKLTGQAEMISALSFSPDSRLLLTGGFNAVTLKHPVEVLLWQVETGKILRRMPVSQRVESVAFSPDARMGAASVGTTKVFLWTL
jgi:WD40 repeat protein